jgi:hypothetical protein
MHLSTEDLPVLVSIKVLGVPGIYISNTDMGKTTPHNIAMM